MFYKMSEKEEKIMNEIEKITGMTYCQKNSHLIGMDEIVSALEDLHCEYERKVEELQDFKEDVKENYKRINEKEMYF